MDTSTSIGSDAVPNEDDISLCISCGTAYVRHGGKWAPMTEAETEGLPSDMRDLMNGLERLRQTAVDKDFAAPVRGKQGLWEWEGGIT
jgi:hypothetical protein